MNIEFINSHTHDFSSFPGELCVVNRFPGEPLEPWDGMNFYSAGIHPWYVNASTLKDELEILRSLLIRDDVISVGEAGLDRACDTDFELQKQAFIMQADLAAETGSPLTIHCVRAYPELISIRKKFPESPAWMIHGFHANAEITKQLLKNNFFFSFGTDILDRRLPATDTLAVIPADRIFLETDDKVCDLHEIYQKAAEIKEMELEELKKQIISNFKNVFKVNII